MVARDSAGIAFARQAMSASCVNISATWTWVGHAQIDAQSQSDSNADGFIVKSETT
jgi:hypothetical protein